MPICVAAVGIEYPDERLLIATVASLCIQTDEVWKYVGEAPGEIVVVNLRQKEGAAAFAQRGLFPDTVFIALTQAPMTPERTVLPLLLPLQAADMYGALESAGAVLSAARGTLLRQLHPSVDPSATYRLSHWPSMEVLGAPPSLPLLKVAAYLSKRVGTVQEITARTGLLPAAVADALKIYALNGYLEVVPRARVVEQLPARSKMNQAEAPTKRSLFQRIRAKLGLGS